MSECKCGRRMLASSNDGICVCCGHGTPISTGEVDFFADLPAHDLSANVVRLEPLKQRARLDHREWTARMILAAIRRWERDHGRPPRKAEWNRAGAWWPNWRTAAAPFGTWKDAIRAAGFEPPAQGRPPKQRAA